MTKAKANTFKYVMKIFINYFNLKKEKSDFH